MFGIIKRKYSNAGNLGDKVEKLEKMWRSSEWVGCQKSASQAVYFGKDEKAVLHLDLCDSPGSECYKTRVLVCAAGTSDTSSLHSEINQVIVRLVTPSSITTGSVPECSLHNPVFCRSFVTERTSASQNCQ